MNDEKKTIGGFSIDDIYLKPQAEIQGKWYLLVAYIDAHTLYRHFDETYKPDNWQFDYDLIYADGKVYSVRGKLTINNLTRTDGGDGDTLKEAVSDAVKRAYHQFPDSNRFLWFQRQVFVNKSQCEKMFKKGKVSLAQLGGHVDPKTMQLSYDVPQIEAPQIPSVEDWEKEFELVSEEKEFNGIMNRLRPLWNEYSNEDKKRLKEVKDHVKERVMPLGRLEDPSSHADDASEPDRSLLGDEKNKTKRVALMASCKSKKLNKVVVTKDDIIMFVNNSYGRHLDKPITSRNEIPMYLYRFVSAYVMDLKAEREQEA